MTAGHLQLIAILALAVAPVAARAAPLDADTCAKLQAEQAQLEEAGVGEDMAKGAAWAKDNLGLVKLQRVQRFIEIEEQLLFRCKSKTIVLLPPETEPGENDKAKAKAPGKAQPRAKPAPKKPPPAANKTRANNPAANKGAARAAAREPGTTSIMKQAPKTKVDDAYEAPPPEPSINPFTTQLVPAED